MFEMLYMPIVVVRPIISRIIMYYDDDGDDDE